MADIEKIKEIADEYGYEPQSRQLIEEMAELTQAINKMWRKSLLCGKMTLKDVLSEESATAEYKNVIEEMADVQIMIWQIAYLLKADESGELDAEIKKKVDRQMERINRKRMEG